MNKEEESLSEKRIKLYRKGEYNTNSDGVCYFEEDIQEAVRKLKEEFTNWLIGNNKPPFAERIDKIFGEKLV